MACAACGDQAAAIGGELTIKGRLGKGTEVRLTFRALTERSRKNTGRSPVNTPTHPVYFRMMAAAMTVWNGPQWLPRRAPVDL